MDERMNTKEQSFFLLSPLPERANPVRDRSCKQIYGE